VQRYLKFIGRNDITVNKYILFKTKIIKNEFKVVYKRLVVIILDIVFYSFIYLPLYNFRRPKVYVEI